MRKKWLQERSSALPPHEFFMLNNNNNNFFFFLNKKYNENFIKTSQLNTYKIKKLKEHLS